MSIGIWQIVLILVIVLLLFGAGKLPRLMGDFAKGIKNFKSGMKEGEAPPQADTGQTAQSTQADTQASATKTLENESATVDTSTVKKDEAAKS